jgi:hypothetical protein
MAGAAIGPKSMASSPWSIFAFVQFVIKLQTSGITDTHGRPRAPTTAYPQAPLALTIPYSLPPVSGSLALIIQIAWYFLRPG